MIRTVLALVALAASAHAQAPVAGVVFEDTNGNGVRDPGERGVPNVVVSNQDVLEKTDASGNFRIARGPTGIVFVSVPDGFRIVGSFWHSTDELHPDFALERARVPTNFTFIHASDTHISPASVARTRRFRAMADSVNPAFVIVTGDLVRDALRVNEAEATSYYDLFAREVAGFRNAVWTVPGNHENFGIERAQSKVESSHPLYGRGMYRHYRGPDYYSFTYGGMHFVGLNSVDIDDQWYYGHVDSVQVAWLKRDLAAIPAEMPVVTFNHIPFFTAVESINGYSDAPPAPSVITVNGKSQFRHSVSNAREILTLVGMNRYAIALAGHMHVREQLRYAGIPLRFYQTAAVVGPGGSGVLTFPSGITVYRVTNGVVDDGTFLPIDPVAPQR
ncbi:MAG: hypothetical protein JWM95_2250 [Gemmatimonadetes bacterium]|nr:hypothetical protein [Gemmatimonadota bacterium]